MMTHEWSVLQGRWLAKHHLGALGRRIDARMAATKRPALPWCYRLRVLVLKLGRAAAEHPNVFGFFQ